MPQTTAQRKLSPLQGRADFMPDTFNDADNSIEVVFATETPVPRSSWGEQYVEILMCRTPNVRMDRMNNGGPVLDTHDKYSIRSQFGVVQKAWVDSASNQMRAKITLSKQPDWAGVVQDIKLGIIRNISVGYMVYRYEVDDSDTNAAPIYTATDWEPCELSFVPVPADYNSGSRSQEPEHDVTIIRNKKNANIMTDAEKAAIKAANKRSADIFKACRAAKLGDEYAEELVNSERSLEDALTAIADKKAAVPAPGTPENRSAIAKEERDRISQIRKAGLVAGVEDTFLETLIDGGVALSDARAQIIDRAAEKNPVTPKPTSGITMGVDEREKKDRGMEASIMQRAGVLKADTVGDPGEFRGATLMDIAKATLETAGVKWKGQSQREIATRALQMQTRDGGGGLASGDFAFILQNVMNKTLRAMYDLQPRTFTPWTRKSTATDFKNMLRTQLSDVKLGKVQEGGEYGFATVSDSGETYRVAKYGKIVNIDWETIINDDLNAFSRVPTLLSGAVAQLQGDQVYAILTGNPTMGDTFALFDATNHLNFTSAGTDITVASLGLARKQFRQQTSPGGNLLNLAPKYLVVGPAKEMAALQFTSQNYVATKNADINVWVGMLQVIVDARITDNSWFLVADPMQIDTAEYATLEGQDIYSETRYGFDVDALQYKVRTVFGAKAIEWRSFYKNAGA